MDTDDPVTDKIDPHSLPRHIAIIMDGNGRWAAAKKLPRIAGHREGVKRVDDVVTYCRKIGIEALTLYSFSSENWKRPTNEVSTLMRILQEYLLKELNRMVSEDICFNTIGDISTLPDFARDAIENVREKTKNNKGMTLTLALSYGSRDEIVRAVRYIATEIKNGGLEPKSITETTITKNLDTFGLPEPDLMIRTSGEYRISNFLLWQSAYTELYFTEKFWPDFTGEDVAKAIVSFQKRERRFGLTTDQLSGGKG